MSKSRPLVLKNRIKVLRAERNLSQTQLAIKAETTQNTISSIETGQYCPTAYNALRIAKALGCTVEECFYFDIEDRKNEV